MVVEFGEVGKKEKREVCGWLDKVVLVQVVVKGKNLGCRSLRKKVRIREKVPNWVGMDPLV